MRSNGNGYKVPQRFTQHKVDPKFIRAAIKTLREGGHLGITSAGVALVQQTRHLCKAKGIAEKSAEGLEIANKVLRILVANPAMVEVWHEWCKREDVRIDSQSAILAFDKMYQRAIQ